MKISQKATNKKKIVKDEKPTNRDSKGRFFSGSTSAFKGRKHSKKTRKKMTESRNKYFEKVDMDEYRKYHVGKKQSEDCKKKHSILSKKMWSDEKWAKERRKQIKKQNQDPKVRAKISKALKGKPKSQAHNKKVSEAIKEWWNKPENRKKMTGKNAHTWKGGITPLRKRIRNCTKYKEWRLLIMERDNYTCNKCSQRGGWKEVDHYPITFAEILKIYKIDSLKKALNCDKLWDINNGRTLCRKCHRN